MKPADWWKAHPSVSFMTLRGADSRVIPSGLLIYDDDDSATELDGYDDHQKLAILRAELPQEDL